MASTFPSTFAARLSALEADIAAACREAGRAREAVTLVAVSKTHPQEAARAALEAGLRHFGENRVQEAAAKWPALREAFPDLDLHLIGALQTNKADDAVRLFDVIETLDRPRLVEALVRAEKKLGVKRRYFIEVNVGDEAQKAGVAEADLPDLHRMAREAGLTVVGLMAIPPAGTDATPYFRKLAHLAGQEGLQGLSMGMSGDFPQAIAEGATAIRVGTRLFGAR